ncbi:MAG: pitrilysin family protein [Candidatus Competibacteraceae bacterium]|jgi:predicted Zn-dependent peptidase|nr:pitrilysin family protein [Candidatus Competibacteraceae bacterium]
MIHSTHFPNGLRLITRSIPSIRSAAIGVWLVNGVRHQQPETNGYAHLLEHLLFKGTSKFDALGLAHRLDGFGGQVNAQTGRELTAFYGLVPGVDAARLLDLFIHMLLNPRFDKADVETERSVVMQEMASVAADPEQVIEEQAISRAWADHPLGWPLLGNQSVIEQAKLASLRDYLNELLQGNRLLIVAVGRVKHALLEAVCRLLVQLPAGAVPATVTPGFHPGSLTRHFPYSQSYCHWLLPIPAPRNSAYPALLVANHLLGGGTASRLFQKLREIHGLSYSVQTKLEFYSDTGLWQVGAVCDPVRTEQCRRIVSETLQQLRDEGPTKQELAGAKRHLFASLKLEQDSPLQCMERLAREALYRNYHPSEAEYRSWVRGVTAERVRQVLHTAWEQSLSVTWEPEADRSYS